MLSRHARRATAAARLLKPTSAKPRRPGRRVRARRCGSGNAFATQKPREGPGNLSSRVQTFWMARSRITSRFCRPQLPRGRHPVHTKGRIMPSRHRHLREAANTPGNQGISTTAAPTVSKPVEGESLRWDSGPHDGDVLVARQPGSPVFFSVCQVPAVMQLRASSRDVAVRLATGFARKYAVDVWYDEDGAFRILKAYRPRTAIQTVDITVGRRS